MKNGKQVLLVFSLFVLLFISLVLAETIKIYPSDDAYTDSSKANITFNNDDLKSGYDLNHGKHRTYLKFDLSSLNGKIVTNSNFSIRAISIVGTPTINLNYVQTDSWSETGLTWDNAPSINSLIDSKIISSSGRIVYDLNSVINESDNILSLALTSQEEQTPNIYVQFFSKDYLSEGERPYLEVNYQEQINSSCTHVLCTLYCANGFKTNEGGCEVCQCNEEINVTSSSCTDSDSGLNFKVKGEVTFKGQTYSDNCMKLSSILKNSSSFLTEYSCKNNAMVKTTYDCLKEGKLCLDGKCFAKISLASSITNAKNSLGLSK